MAGRNSRKKENKIEWIYMLPFLILLAVVPLLVHAHVYQAAADLEVYESDGTKTAIDFISYYKSVFTIGAGILMAVLTVYALLMQNQKHGRLRVFWPLGLYALLVFLSACFSKYKTYAFGGMDGLFESVWVLLSYCLAAFYAFFVVDRQSMLRKLVLIFQISMSLLCLYGMVELVFGNPMSWDVAKNWLYTPNQLANYGDTRDIALQGVTLTFYNSNYVGSFMALAIPISLVLFFAQNKVSWKIWNGCLFLMEWVILIGSQARSGMVAVVISLLVMTLLERRKLSKLKKWLLLGLGLMVVLYLALEIPNGFRQSKRLLSMLELTNTGTGLEKIETLSDSVEITYKGNTLHLVYQGYDQEKPFLATCGGEEIPYTLDGKVWSTEDARFDQIQLAAMGSASFDYFDVGIEGLGWRFVDAGESAGYYFVNPAHCLVKIQQAKKALPRKYWRFANGRGYVWAKTLPLLKNYIFLGSGPDTFYMVYPWNDYVDQSYVIQKETVFNRPHSLYLQMGIQTGVLSLLAFLVFVGGYLLQSLRIYGKRRTISLNQIEILGFGIFGGVLGYLITGLVNDSMVGIAQFFWCFIGFGIGINQMVENQRKKA
jgi:hypothetical protein